MTVPIYFIISQYSLLCVFTILSFLSKMGLGEVTKLLKFHTKHHRTRGVHVTPTVYMNSIEAPDVSSGWSAEQWVEKLRSVCGE